MIRRILILLILCGMPLFLIGCGNSSGPSQAHHGEGHDHDHGGGFAEPREITSGNPHFDFTIEQDEHGDYYVELELDGFVITHAGDRSPLSANEYAGHAHLYIDREMERMVYQKQFPLPVLKAGKHTISIMLSDPDHRPYLLDGELVRKTIVLEIPDTDGS